MARLDQIANEILGRHWSNVLYEWPLCKSIHRMITWVLTTLYFLRSATLSTLMLSIPGE